MQTGHFSFGAAVAVILAAGCSAPVPDTRYTEITQPTDNTYSFRHDVRIVRGAVWLFEADGSPVQHGGPVGVEVHSHTYVVEVLPKSIDLSNGRSAQRTDSVEIATLIHAVGRFCKETGYERISAGAGIHTTADSILFVTHCVPKGVEIPRDGKAGDDVQRDPLSRALGIPTLRGRDFIRRYGL